jgi:peptidoglycan/xylan/chitin deacetylase (PgdA/CDA1 family)
MIAVMYHYVRPEVEKPPFGYFHLDLADFQRQLDHFETEYNVLSRDGFLKTIDGERTPQPNDLLLTFDDGLRDHAEYVLPELRSRDMFGVFYVPAGPYTEGLVLNVHRIHSLIGRAGGSAIVEALDTLIDESMVSDERRDEFIESTYQPQDNPDELTRAKRYLNYFLKDEHVDQVLNQLEERFLDNPLTPESLYMSRGDIRDLEGAGMHIGAHSVTHSVLSQQSVSRQQWEIGESFSFLEATLDTLEFRTFCYPYGTPDTYSDETRSILDESGCSCSFVVEARDLLPKDISNNRHTLPRYDCNQFKHGEATATIGHP